MSMAAVEGVEYNRRELSRLIIRLVAEGISFKELERRRGMPCRRTFQRWEKILPGFRQDLREARTEALVDRFDRETGHRRIAPVSHSQMPKVRKRNHAPEV